MAGTWQAPVPSTDLYYRDEAPAVARLAETVDQAAPDQPVTVLAGDVQAALDLIGHLMYQASEDEAHWQES